MQNELRFNDGGFIKATGNTDVSIKVSSGPEVTGTLTYHF